MNDCVYVVIYRYNDNQPWRPELNVVFEERRLAESLVEIQKLQNPTWQYQVLECQAVDNRITTKEERGSTTCLHPKESM